MDMPRKRMLSAGSTNETSVTSDLISRMPPITWPTVTSPTLTSACSFASFLVRSRHSGNCAEILSCRIMTTLLVCCSKLAYGYTDTHVYLHTRVHLQLYQILQCFVS